MINVDETKASLDWSNTQAGGRPAMSFRDPHLPQIMKLVAKLSYECNAIFGSNAAGELVPVHSQLPTSATSAEREKLHYDFCFHLKNNRGQFGHDKVREWPCGIGMNEKGGMNDEEFHNHKYLNNTIYSLFPDMEDVPGKRVLLKVDSGPGRNCMDLLFEARFHGLYIFPGLPNATALQQEIDHNYGPFKGVIRQNLDAIVLRCFTQKVPISLPASTIGLIVFVGVCPQTGVVCKDAVAEAFSVESNLASWAAVGAVPFTMKCPSDDNVCHDGNDVNDDKYQIIQSKNNYSCTQLLVMGYDADLLKTGFDEDRIKAAAEDSTLSVMVANTREQQEALVKATTHGKKFFVTGGEHINLNDMFISAEMGNREREIAEMEKGKKVRIEFHVRRNATLVVLDGLDHELDGNIDRLTNKDLEVLLRWKGVLPSKMGNMANRRALYQQFAGDRGDDDLGDPPRWTEVDEANLEERRNAPIEMCDTAYGRFEAGQ